MTQRIIAQRHLTDLDRPDSPNALLWLLTIDHPNLSEPIRVVSDYFEYLIGGALYLAMPFEVQPLTDNDQQTFAQLRMQNIDRRIGQALDRDLAGIRAVVTATAHMSSDFDLSVEPRVPLNIDDLPAIYHFEQFELADVQVNAVDITGKISLVDVTQEPWPFTRATADRFPGLFV